MLDIIDQIREKTDMPSQAICNAVRVSYSNYSRWIARRKRMDTLVRQPGPPKVGRPDFGRLCADIMTLPAVAADRPRFAPDAI